MLYYDGYHEKKDSITNLKRRNHRKYMNKKIENGANNFNDQKNESDYIKGQYSLFEEDFDRDELCFDIFFKEGPFGIMLLDRYFQIGRLNQKLEKMLEYKPKEMLGRQVFEFLAGEDALSLKSVLQNGQALKTPLLVSLRFVKDKNKVLITDTYVRKYKTKIGDEQYCLLIFDKEFSPNGQLLELKQEIYHTIIATQEQERQNIGRLLHDSTAQLLYAIRLNLQHQTLKSGEKDWMLPMKEMLNEAIFQIRNISMDLVPSVLNDFGLKAAIGSMSERITIPDFQVIPLVQEKCEELSEEMKLAIYRIVQELLNNCMKHAVATRIRVKVTMKDDWVNVEVGDNGKGFKKEVKECMEEGSGLRNIQNRINFYNGSIKIKTQNTGTTVLVTLQVI